MTLYYDIAAGIAILCAVAYIFIWQKHFDVHMTLVFTLVPIVNLGYALMAHALNVESALQATKICYLGGSFLQLMVLLVVSSLCEIRISRWLKALLLLLCIVMYGFVLSAGHSGLFYQSVQFIREGDSSRLVKEYGVMHTVFSGMVLFFYALSLGMLAYSFMRKKQISRKILVMLFLPEEVALSCFFLMHFLHLKVDLMPGSYAVALVFYLMIAHRLPLYDVNDTAVDTLAHSGSTGFITFDFRLRYLGSNEAARAVFPGLSGMTVDRSNRKEAVMTDRFLPWIEAFQADPSRNRRHFEAEDRIYGVELSPLYNGKKEKGYQLVVTDDTKDQQRIRLLNHYNADLQAEVEQKTAHILEMHDQLILSMATMVESRDNSTGGHIRRTSTGVRLLIRAMEEEGLELLEPEACKNLIKAAPMHDLGKIAVDDAILRKPGRFSPEEFEKMKRPAAEGARIVHEILKDTDDDAFHELAENVAHFHHERWDGSGYPEGLRGEQIPIEARVMAVADVYDALVSKRVYKDKMSYEKAHAIIMEGMGSQFDPQMEAIFLRAEPALQAYYDSLPESGG